VPHSPRHPYRRNLIARVDRARAADEAQAKGKPWGRLHGVPILMKDAKMTAGIRSTCGAKFYANHVPKKNGPAVQNLPDARRFRHGPTNKGRI
jgi:Asp-tRNA(Asn)/Glu-tRNA(Gln) amidotransferase A subunit family amidase